MNRNLSDGTIVKRRPTKLLVAGAATLLLFLTMLVVAVTQSAAPGAGGVAAPSRPAVGGIQLAAVKGDEVVLSDYVGRKPTLLYFSMGVG